MEQLQEDMFTTPAIPIDQLVGEMEGLIEAKLVATKDLDFCNSLVTFFKKKKALSESQVFCSPLPFSRRHITFGCASPHRDSQSMPHIGTTPTENFDGGHAMSFSGSAAKRFQDRVPCVHVSQAVCLSVYQSVRPSVCPSVCSFLHSTCIAVYS